MSLKHGTELLERRQLSCREVIQLRHRGILNDGGVPFAHQKPVAPVPFWMLRVVLHLPAVKHGDDVRRRAGAANMTRLAHAHHQDDVPPHPGREVADFPQFIFINHVLTPFFAKASSPGQGQGQRWARPLRRISCRNPTACRPPDSRHPNDMFVPSCNWTPANRA